jgi:Family of unknown function (DUF6516)
VVGRMEALVRRRVVVAADTFVEAVIWQVPESAPPSVHLFKYRLTYVIEHLCVLRYDNEREKNDHRHTETAEEPYTFSTPRSIDG